MNDQAHHRRPSNHFKKHWGNPAICIFRPSSYDWRECEALCRNNRQIWEVIYSYYTDILWIMTTYYDTSSDIMIYHVLRYIMMYYDILWYIMLCILHVYIYICTCLYIYMYMFLCTYLYSFTHYTRLCNVCRMLYTINAAFPGVFPAISGPFLGPSDWWDHPHLLSVIFNGNNVRKAIVYHSQ